MPFRAEAVANRFIEMGKDKGEKITLLKLLKLVYFAHGWHLGLSGAPLISEQVEAWKFGPVAPSVYHGFKENGSDPISELYKFPEFDPEDDTLCWNTPRIEHTPSLDRFFNAVWGVYGPMTAYQLSALTHQEGTPWHKVWYELGGCDRKGTDIPDDLIADYFKRKLPVDGKTS